MGGGLLTGDVELLTGVCEVLDRPGWGEVGVGGC